jgi:predicted nucleic acid-binding protein
MIDTNLLVYMFEDADEYRHGLAYELLEEIMAGSIKAAVSTQSLSELFVNLTAEKKRTVVSAPIDIASADVIIKDIASTPHFTILCIMPKNVLEAIGLRQSSKASYWDCLIAATMKENGVTTIYTEDKEFEKIEGIRAINPFERAKARAKTI